MNSSKKVSLSFFALIVGFFGIAFTGWLIISANQEGVIHVLILISLWIIGLFGLSTSISYYYDLSRREKEINKCICKKETELLMSIGNVISEYLVDKNSSYLEEEKRRFYPMSLRYDNPGTVIIVLIRKHGESCKREILIMYVCISLSQSMNKSEILSLKLRKGDENEPVSFFSLGEIDKLLKEIRQNIKDYILPED